MTTRTTQATTEQLPFHDLAEKGKTLAKGIKSDLERLLIVLGDIDAAERNKLWRAAQEQGEELYDTALTIAERGRYVLNVVDAQGIGNTSSAWLTGIRSLREALDEFERLHD